MSVLLEAAALSVSYGDQSPAVLRDVDLVLEAGASVGVVGESGCGKTTLARALSGVVQPTSGSVKVGGRPWSAIRRRDAARREVQLIFQDPYASLNPRLSASASVAEVFRVWEGLRRADARARAVELLRHLGLSPDAMDRRPRQLSGGQCQRVGIARALACSPSVLIADEPTSSLDVSVQAQILNLIRELCEERGLSLLLVSHDLAVVRYMADEVIVMYGGRIVERGPTEDVFSRPAHPYTRLLIGSVPGGAAVTGPVDNKFESNDGCVFARHCPQFQPECSASEPQESGSDRHRFRCYYPRDSSPQRRERVGLDDVV